MQESQSIDFMYHAYTVYLFIRNDMKDMIGLSCVFGASNALVAPILSMGPALSFMEILLSSPKMILWCWSNLFLFNLHNQRHPASIAEDSMNKPWRPLPAGRITPRQAERILYIMYPVIILVSSAVGGMVPCVAQAFFSLWYNELGGAADPFLKNLINGLGYGCFLAGPLEIVTRRSVFSEGGKAAIWLGVLAAIIATISHTQDFRDMEGDKAAGRSTIPLIVGDNTARVTVLLGVACWTGVTCWYWGAGWTESLIAWISGGLMVGNLFYDRTVEGDSASWKLCSAWLLCLMLLPVFCGMKTHGI
ncbi:UbiA prenyltransferase family-domain-containing protein [Daldinia eschscholtzii]|nr:UbiA prenyltransferase family-domain-containing protein [Daldinia eschscholtzii]